jgi:ArsR family metal-binding transcriptional regulator
MIAYENLKKSKYTKILKKEINGNTYFAVVWTKTNRVVSVYWKGEITIHKIASFNEKNKRRLNAFKNISMHFQQVGE